MFWPFWQLQVRSNLFENWSKFLVNYKKNPRKNLRVFLGSLSLQESESGETWALEPQDQAPDTIDDFGCPQLYIKWIWVIWLQTNGTIPFVFI